MDDFLTAVKTVHAKPIDRPAQNIITAVSSRTNAQPATSSSQSGNASTSAPLQHSSTPLEALHILRSEPNVETVHYILQRLGSPTGFDDGFTLQASSPVQAQIVNTLLNSVVPNFWSVFTKQDKNLLATVLLNTHGVGAVVSKVRLVAQDAPPNRDVVLLNDLLSLTEILFRGDNFIRQIWTGLCVAVVGFKRTAAWKEFVSLIGSGKVIASVAQAEDALKTNGPDVSAVSCWLSEGSKYASWLGRNIARMNYILACEPQPDGTAAASAQLLVKALNLGYPLSLVSMFLDSSRSVDISTWLGSFVRSTPTYAQKLLIEQNLRWLSTKSNEDHDFDKPDGLQSNEVSALAAQLSLLLNSASSMLPLLESMLLNVAITTSFSFLVRRACFSLISSIHSESLTSIHETLSTTFGDSLFIAHAPISQQENLAQNLLLAAGYLHRATPMAVLMTARSSGHMKGIGNRLDSSNQRARWLGMVVGTAVSSLVDKPGATVLNFGTDDMDTAEARWYMNIVKVHDVTGTIEDAQQLLKQRENPKPKRRRTAAKQTTMPLINGKPTFGPMPPPQKVQTEVIGDQIAELSDSSGSDSKADRLKPHRKPDSDPEDSDEDATMINRSKPRAPVYIRDLMKMIQDDKEPARFEMGMKHAATLIRRKTNHGSEVKDHANELLTLLSNLQDPFATDGFDEMRLQTMIAVFVSEPSTLGPYLSRRLFSGEYSIAQRCMMLSTLGLGGRELAGFQSQDDLNPAVTAADDRFPSKHLPPHLHAIYTNTTPSTKRLENTSTEVERSLIQPIALRAADQQTAELNAVKVRTFSSRISAERTKRKPAANKLAQILGPAIFHPLISRYQQEVMTYGSGSVWSATPMLLVTLVKTLAILLHAAGPVTTELREITVAFWPFLLSLRVAAVGDIAILSSVLFGLLALLEVNMTTTSGQQRLVDEHAKDLMETQQWVELVFERLGGGDVVDDTGTKSEEAKVRALAAGVLVKAREVIETYQRQLFGQVLE